MPRRSLRLAPQATSTSTTTTIAASNSASCSITTTTTSLLAAKKNSDTNDNSSKTEARPVKRIKVNDDSSPAVTPSPTRKTTTRKQSSSSAAAAATKPTATKKKAATNTSAKKSSSPTNNSPQRNNSKATTTALVVQPPKDWQGTYQLVKELRQDKTAPVDHAGAEVLPERCHGDKVFRFQVLICLMLSSQTKDAVVGEAVRQLQQHGLTLENIAYHTSPEKLNHMIQKVGFHNNKTKYIKQVCDILLQQYQGDIPKTAQEMIDNLPGVGPKMAFLIETIAWGTTSGIGVDVHMNRMFNQIGWVKSKTPEQTRLQLEAWLPRELWCEINYVWVGFGQEAQQYKPKILRKALDCSRPLDALKLLKKVGVDVTKESQKAGWADEVKAAMTQQQNGRKQC